MDFITYTSYEIVAVLKGLIGLEFINNALLAGNIVAPVLWFFMFLSLWRIGLDWFGKRDYQAVAKHIAFFTIFVFLTSFTATFNIYNMNIVKYFIDENVSSFWEGIDVKRDTANSRIVVSNVPIMASILAFPDMLAYELSKTLFTADDKSVDKDMIGMKIRTNPSFLLDLAYLDFIQSDTTSEAVDRIYGSAYCFGVPEYMKRNYPEEEELYSMIFSKNGILARITKSTDLGWMPVVGKCNKFLDEYTSSIRKMTGKYINGSDDGSKLLRKYFYKLADRIKNEKAFPISLKESITRNLIATKNITENTYNLIKSGHLDNNWHGFKEAVQNLYSSVKAKVSEVVADNYYNEMFMYKLQQVLEFLFIALLPLILAMTFLPAFGYNFKLLGTAVFSYFLIKMWIPIYYIAHQLLYNHTLSSMNVYLSKAVSIFIGTAYASPLDTAILIDTVMPETEHFNDLILNTLAMVIPTALGGGSLFFFGREFIGASMRSVNQSMGLFKSAVGFATGGIGRKGLGTGEGSKYMKVQPDTPKPSNTGETATFSQSLKGGGTEKTHFIQDSKSGLFIPNRTEYVVNNVRQGGYTGNRDIGKGYGLKPQRDVLVANKYGNIRN